MKRSIIILAAAASLFIASGAAQADTRQEQEIRDYGTYLVGLGVSLASVESDDKVYFDGEAGSGFDLMIGHRFNDRLTLEVTYIGLTVADKLFEVLSAGPRLDLVPMEDNTFIPWVAVHVSHISLEQELDTETVSMSGISLAATGGVDMRVGKKGFIQFALRHYPFTSDLKVGGTTADEKLDSALSVFSVTYVAHTW